MNKTLSCSGYEECSCCEDRVALLKENKRLKSRADRYEKALRQIALPTPVISRDNYQEALLTVKRIAKEALQSGATESDSEHGEGK